MLPSFLRGAPGNANMTPCMHMHDCESTFWNKLPVETDDPRFSRSDPYAISFISLSLLPGGQGQLVRLPEWTPKLPEIRVGSLQRRFLRRFYCLN